MGAVIEKGSEAKLEHLLFMVMKLADIQIE